MPPTDHFSLISKNLPFHHKPITPFQLKLANLIPEEKPQVILRSNHTQTELTQSSTQTQKPSKLKATKSDNNQLQGMCPEKNADKRVFN